MTPRLTIVVPTLGRPTLPRTLASIVPQLGPGDDVIVVADATGDPPGAHRSVEELDHGQVRFEECLLRLPGVGNAPRLLGMELALGTHLLFMDDDDVYVPGALTLIRAAACERPVIFRMNASNVGLGVLWADPALTYANVGTPMFVVPNRPGLLGEWAPYNELGQGSDFTFITGCCDRMGDPEWREEIVALIRPAANPAGPRDLALQD